MSAKQCLFVKLLIITRLQPIPCVFIFVHKMQPIKWQTSLCYPDDTWHPPLLCNWWTFDFTVFVL